MPRPHQFLLLLGYLMQLTNERVNLRSHRDKNGRRGVINGGERMRRAGFDQHELTGFEPFDYGTDGDVQQTAENDEPFVALLMHM